MTRFHSYETAEGHRLSHDPLKAIVAPRPICWVSTVRESRGDEAWFAELAVLDPDAHATEKARRQAEQARIEAEEARLAEERVQRREAELAKKWERAAAQARLVPKVNAYEMCKRAVQSRVKFPSKSDYALFSVRHWGCEGKTCIAGNVELMNGVGLMVPHVYYCEMTKSGVTQVGIEPGSS